MRAGRAVEATNSGSLREPNSNARRGRQKDSGARLFARRKSPSRSTATPREPSRRRPAQRMRKPLRFRAVRDLSRPTPTRTALKPESREGRRNQQLRQFGHPEKRQSRTLGQANRLRRHWNRNPVMALKRLRRNGRSGKSRRPAILEYGPSPDAAGAALAESTTELRATQPKIVAQGVKQGRVRVSLTLPPQPPPRITAAGLIAGPSLQM